MNQGLQVQIEQVLNAGHFFARPVGSHYECIMGQINDYFQSGKGTTSQPVIPQKGKIYAVKHITDNCWYRAEVLNIMTTMCGPQARTHLVDIGTTTLHPFSLIRELPDEFACVPYQRMNCFLAGVQPLSMVTSYFDYTTTKKVSDHWSEAANNFFTICTKGCKLTVYVKHVMQNGDYKVLLYAKNQMKEICVNDELVKSGFAALSPGMPSDDESPTKAHRRRQKKEEFQRKTQELVAAFNLKKDANTLGPNDASSTDDEFYSPQRNRRRFGNGAPQDELVNDGNSYSLSQQHAGTRESEDKGEHLSMPNSTQNTYPVGPYLIGDRGSHDQIPGQVPQASHPNVPENNIAASQSIKNGVVSQSMQNSAASQSIKKGVASQSMQNSAASQSMQNSAASQSIKKGEVSQSMQDSAASQSIKKGVASQSMQNSAASQSMQNSAASQSMQNSAASQSMQNSTASQSMQNSAASQSMQISGSIDAIARLKQVLNLSRSGASATNLNSGLSAYSQALDPVQHGNSGITYQLGTMEGSSTIRRAFSVSSEEEQGRVRFMSARLPATGQGTPRTSPAGAIPKLKPILKNRTPPQQQHISSSNTDQRLVRGRVTDAMCSEAEFKFAERNTVQPIALPSEIGTGPHKASTSSQMVFQDEVLIQGESAPRPFLTMNNSTFYEYGPRLGVTVPTSLQKHMWPSLLRGRDVAGVAIEGSGKRLAYLLPIIHQITESSVYQELPLANGPLVLILCTNWQNTARVYGVCEDLIRNRRRTRVQMIFGGGAEEDRIVPLINGCEVLVATPPCFLRMLKRCYTSLDRLCHVVFDDADMLAEYFTAEIKEIMRLYGRLLKKQPARLAPRQTVALATRWSPGLASLIRAYLGNPLVILTDVLEASLFAKVDHTATICSENQRIPDLIAILERKKSTHDIVIFTITAEEANNLAGCLRSQSHYVIVAHEFLQPHELTHIRRQWNTPHDSAQADSVPILVMTDGVLEKLPIQNASLVIHYDFPTKGKYTRRLTTMANTFTTIKDHKCMTLAYLTEKSIPKADNAYQLVRRSQGNTLDDTSDKSMPVNSLLEEVAKVSKLIKEQEKANMQLCHRLMVLGACRFYQDNRKCLSRHVVLKEVDFPRDFPTCGTVKILVMHVTSATELWVRILEHRDPRGNIVPSSVYDSMRFLKLTMDMSMWYGVEGNRVKVEVLRVSDLCALEQGGTYYRVKVCDIIRRNQSRMPLVVEVQFVDTGVFETCKVEKLFQLPVAFRELPFQAVQVIVCRVKPLDKDQEWTHKANYFVKKMVEGKELEGKVVFSLSNTLWLDPLLERRVLKNINVTTNMNNIRLELIKQGLAIENSQHVKNLKSQCEDVIDLSIYDGPEIPGSDPSSTLETVVLSEDDFTEVFVSAVENPGLFFVQLNSSSANLQELEDVLNDGVTSVGSDDSDVLIGSLCLARFSVDDLWYRARVLGMRGDSDYDVFFVDYGDREWVPRDRVQPASEEVLQLPLQAIECSLVNVLPLENDWTLEDSDAFFNMTKGKLLLAKVKSKVGSLVSGCHCFVVELHDTSTIHDIEISQEIVAIGHAQTSPEAIQTWFPEAARPLGQEEYVHEYERIPEMCLQILRSRDYPQKLDIAKSLQTIAMKYASAKDAIRECGGVNSLCKLLMLTRAPAIQEHLLVCLSCVTFQNDNNCEEARRAGALKTLCLLLEKSSSVVVQQQVASTLKNVCTTDRNKNTVHDHGWIKVLCSVLQSATDEKLQENLAWAVEELVSDNDRNCQAVSGYGGTKVLCHLVANSISEGVTERATRALAALAAEPSNRNEIRLHGGLAAICSHINSNAMEEYVRTGICALKILVSNNNSNRDVLRDLGMVVTLQSILLSPKQTSTITRRLCKDLLEKLVGWAATTMPTILSPLPQSPGVQPRPSVTPCPGGSPLSSVHVEQDDEMPALEGTDENKAPESTRTRVQAKGRQLPKRKPLILAKPIDKETKSDESGVEEGSDGSCVHPFTVWSQDKHDVRVAVRLRGAKKSRVRTDFKDNSFHFVTRMHDTSYRLDLHLFDSIKPQECVVDVKGSEILVLLRKARGDEWPRLLKSKEKYPYISIDFDRWEVWSSSEEDKTPVRELPKLGPRPSSSPGQAKRFIVPEMDTSGSSSSETEEDFDEDRELISFD